MTKHNAATERIRHDYLGFLADAQGRDSATIDRVAASLARFEASTRAKHFKRCCQSNDHLSLADAGMPKRTLG